MAPDLRSLTLEPLDGPPPHAGLNPSGRQRLAELEHALRGVHLGHHDRVMVEWAVQELDDPTLRTFVAWLERARVAGQSESKHWKPIIVTVAQP